MKRKFPIVTTFVVSVLLLVACATWPSETYLPLEGKLEFSIAPIGENAVQRTDLTFNTDRGSITFNGEHITWYYDRKSYEQEYAIIDYAIGNPKSILDIKLHVWETKNPNRPKE